MSTPQKIFKLQPSESFRGVFRDRGKPEIARSQDKISHAGAFWVNLYAETKLRYRLAVIP